MEYKLIRYPSTKDGSFNATALQQKLNEYAQEGWRVASITHIPGAEVMAQPELLILLEANA